MTERLKTAWRWVAISMAVGAVYDFVFAVAMLLFHRGAASLMGIVPPEDPVYLKFSGILLLLLAGTYLLPALDPARYQGVVAVAAGGRFLGFLYLGAAWLGGQPVVFLGLALADLIFALVHTFLLRLARRRSSPQVDESPGT